MEKKPLKLDGVKAPAGDLAQPAQHRFADPSERTMIMPLAEIMRKSQAAQGKSTDEAFSETTKLSLNPLLGSAQGAAAPTPQAAVARGPNASPPPVTSGSNTVMQPNPLKASEVASTTPQAAAARGLNAPPSPVTLGSNTVVQPNPLTASEVAAPPDKPSLSRSRVMVFFSCKGGSGATAMAGNAAHYYAKRGYKTCLVDLDLQLGDALAALALQPRTTMAQAMAIAQRGEQVQASVLPQHASGVSVLSQVGSLEDLDRINAENVAALIEGLRSTFDIIVVDGVRDFSDNVLAVLDIADQIAIVAVQEVLAIRRARWAFGILRKIGFDPQDVSVVMNRYSPEADILKAALQQVFEPASIVSIGRDENLVLTSLNRGIALQDLNASHLLTRELGTMAAHLLGERAAAPDGAHSAAPDKKSLGDKLRFWKKP